MLRKKSKILKVIDITNPYSHPINTRNIIVKMDRVKSIFICDECIFFGRCENIWYSKKERLDYICFSELKNKYKYFPIDVIEKI